MTDLNTININFERMNDQARILEETAGRLDNLNRSEEADFDGTLKTAWEGENAALFRAKSAERRERMDLIKDKLLQEAAALRSAAQAYIEAETKALEIAEGANLG